MAAQNNPGFDNEDLFLEYCAKHGVAGAARNYVSCMRRMARDLRRRLTPTDVRSEAMICSLVASLTEPGLNVRHHSNFRTVLRKYQDMCRANFKSAFDGFTLAGVDVAPDGVPPRLVTQVSRVVRDTTIARQVKAAHKDHCQFCGDRLELSLAKFYSEGHHLKPLGKPHNGPDVEGNILCVCPNCHVKLDFAASKIDPAKLRKVSGHSVHQEFIDYHNGLCA